MTVRQRITGYDWLENQCACLEALRFVRHYRGQPFRVTFEAVVCEGNSGWIDWLRCRLNSAVPAELYISFGLVWRTRNLFPVIQTTKKWRLRRDAWRHFEPAVNHVLGFTTPKKRRLKQGRKRKK